MGPALSIAKISTRSGCYTWDTSLVSDPVCKNRNLLILKIFKDVQKFGIDMAMYGESVQKSQVTNRNGDVIAYVQYDLWVSENLANAY